MGQRLGHVDGLALADNTQGSDSVTSGATPSATFRDLLEAAQKRNNSTLAIGLAPIVNKLPFEIQRFDDPFLPFSKAVIDTTADLVCAYVFHLGAYLALGAAGAVALERAMAYVPSYLVKILHGPFANDEYVRAAFEDGFGANAVTLAPSASSETRDAYMEAPLHAIFIQAPNQLGVSIVPAKVNQFGIYREYDAGMRLCELFFSKPPLYFEWRTEEIIFASQTDDFRDAMRDTALKFRQKLEFK
jgi:hypothetical protein